ncbi:MAG: PEP-CTERM sorting domain-containing protein [Verrucomicrobiales bacterium]|nr:PEP-CTERM sorting domain-containing protein [Verrucomicrobiae bacterium]
MHSLLSATTIARSLAGGALLLSLSGLASAATLLSWDFSGVPASDGSLENTPAPNPLVSSAAANAIAGIAVSDLTHNGNVTLSTAVAPGGVGTAVAGELNLKNFDAGGDGVNDNYLAFSITANPGMILNVDTISVNLWRNGGGAPNGVAFDVSVDGGAFAPYDSVKDAGGTGLEAAAAHTFTQSIAGANTVDIRFTPRNAGAGSTGNLHISGLSVSGDVAAVPEPSTALLVIIGACAACVGRRRR